MRHLLWIFPVMTGCADVKSSVLDTSGMYLEYIVITEGAGQGTSVNAVLRAGGRLGSFVALEAGDELVVSVLDGEESKRLEMSSFLTMHSYGASFTTETAEAGFELDFRRENLTDAPSSIAILPTSFSVISPEEGLVISRSEQAEGELLIGWDEAANVPMNITIEGNCFTSYAATEVADSVTHIVPISYFLENELDSTEACAATIVVERVFTGSVDAAFGEGVSLGKQLRRLNIQIDP